MFKNTIITALLMMGITGCTSTKEVNDPFEGFNRGMYSFNKGVDKVVFKPLAKGYMYITPTPVQQGVNNFFDNLFYPTVIINQFLQGKFKLGMQDTTRFVFNTTMGIGGLFDIASAGGLVKHEEDFGQTLATWGVNSGPYLVVPIFGSYTVRSGVGEIAGIYTNPLFYVEDDTVKYSLFGLSIIDTRAELLKAEELVSGDEYLFVRDAYLQRREFLVKDKKDDDEDPFLEN